jgi:hypothetical protein
LDSPHPGNHLAWCLELGLYKALMKSWHSDIPHELLSS